MQDKSWTEFCPCSDSVKYTLWMFQSVFLTPLYNLQLSTCDLFKHVCSGEVLDPVSDLRICFCELLLFGDPLELEGRMCAYLETRNNIFQ